MFGKLKKGFDKIIFSFIVMTIGVLTATSFLQVIARYIFQRPPSWSEELARYLFIWLVFIAASVGFRRGVHLGVDFFVSLLPSGLRKATTIGTYVFLSFLLAATAWVGIDMTQMVNFQLSPAMRMPMSWVYAAIPVGAFLMLIEVMIILVNIIREKREAH
jgi:C4-dicarboxylate transporter DctQ subunit